VVGSGTLLPSADRASASFHIRAAEVSILLDAGSGALHGLARADLDWRTLDAVAVTHFHTDHVSDLPALLSAWKYEGSGRPLDLIGPQGLRTFLARLADAYGSWILDPGRPTTVVELSDDDVWRSRSGAFGLRSAPTRHTEESVALRAAIDGLTVGYTGDAGPSEDLAGFLAGATLLIAECALDDPPRIDTHLSPGSVAKLASIARPELLLLTHVYPPLRPEGAVASVREGYEGRIEAARDGMRIRLGSAGVAVDPFEGRV